MGLNLIRFAFEPQYRAVKRWKWAKGDETLRYSVPIPPGGVVLDIGAYTGEYAEELARRTGAHIEAYEPVPDYAAICREKAGRFPGIHVHEYGLSHADFSAEITIDGLASSTYRTGGKSVTAAFRDIAREVERLGIERIALAKINIEGGEYDILPRLIETGLITRFDALMVQFHLVGEDPQARYQSITQALEKTHTLRWRYPFVWELWERKALQASPT